MLIQKVSYPFGIVETAEKMFYTVVRGDYKDSVLEADSLIRFDSYFNMFSVRKWRKYSTVSSLSFYIIVSGKGIIRFFGIANGKRESELIRSVEFVSDTPQKIDIKDVITLECPWDYLYFEIESETRSELLDGSYYTYDEPEVDVKLACCFCTFKREREIKANVEALISGIVDNPDSVAYDSVEIYVSDNGNTLSEGFFSDDAVKVFPNKNYGGSAGFTRCLIESCIRDNDKGFTHVLLMDDDAIILPFVVERTYSLLSYIKPEYQDSTVGGALISKDKPYLQRENGGYWSDGDVVLNNQFFDLRDRDIVISNEDDLKTNYNAWFYCCYPTSLINQENLPFPFFIHGDDQEYCLRISPSIINMNGICIWHPDPVAQGKKRVHMKYYDTRNGLIILAKRSDISKWQLAKSIFKQVFSRCLCFDYETAECILNACLDFYKGIDWFCGNDAESFNASLMKKYTLEDCAEPKCPDGTTCEHSKSKRSRILNWLVLSSRKAAYGFDVDEYYIDWLGLKSVQFWDGDKGVCRSKSYCKMFRILGMYFRFYSIMIKKHDSIMKEWKERHIECESYAFWKEYLGLS